jgi:selenocysteine-specific elongation factor
VNLDHFSRSFNVTESTLATMLAQLDALVIAKAPTYALLKSAIEQLGLSIAASLQHHHRAQPQAPGLGLKALRHQCAPAMQAVVFSALMRHVAAAQQIVIAGAVATLTTHQSIAYAADQMMWQKLQPTLEAMGPKGLTATELAQAAGLKTLVVNDMLHRKVKQGELFRVSSERFYLRAHVIQFATIARELVLASPTQTFIAAQFRDRVGVNRTLAIEILDILDRLGVTQRVGDARKLLKPLETVFAID